MRGHIREIRTCDLFLYFLLPLLIILLLISACILVLIFWDAANPPALILALAVLLYLPTKYFVIGCVLMYKALAPLEVRDRCRFEPCCSTYMIMAIQKYGLFRGVYRGIRRIMRCKPPNGGRDLP